MTLVVVSQQLHKMEHIVILFPKAEHENNKERILMENKNSRLYTIFISFKHMPLFLKKK